MKQYIPEEQYDELTPGQKRKFIEWTASKGSHAVTVRSIAHLLWFLEDHSKRELIEISCTTGDCWHVNVYIAKRRYHGKVLIDQLWDAVKDILSLGEENV